jgi:hypothetical protein
MSIAAFTLARLAETRQEAAAFETRAARLDGSASLSAAR